MARTGELDTLKEELASLAERIAMDFCECPLDYSVDSDHNIEEILPQFTTTSVERGKTAG